jgi:hypothetical protein
MTDHMPRTFIGQRWEGGGRMSSNQHDQKPDRRAFHSYRVWFSRPFDGASVCWFPLVDWKEYGRGRTLKIKHVTEPNSCCSRRKIMYLWFDSSSACFRACGHDTSTNQGCDAASTHTRMQGVHVCGKGTLGNDCPGMAASSSSSSRRRRRLYFCSRAMHVRQRRAAHCNPAHAG